ncbi:MAG: CCDC90 family protein [Deltaproteobacteria bacterium]|nr:CCDC90 family protein [Deltaproteobacteria bacterium]
MTSVTFDTLGYFERLKAAGVPEAQAKVQVEAMQDIVKSYDETSRKELATKGDIKDVRKEIQDVKHEILKWMMGMLLAQSALIVAVISYVK